jgi:hypothetical protein
MDRMTATVSALGIIAASRSAHAGQPWSVEDKEAFVEKCLHDTNVHVFNVPVKMNRHLKQTPAEMNDSPVRYQTYVLHAQLR